MTFWRRYVLNNLQGRPTPDIESGSWPRPAAIDAVTWRADLERLRDVQEELVTWLGAQTEEALRAPNRHSETGFSGTYSGCSPTTAITQGRSPPSGL